MASKSGALPLYQQIYDKLIEEIKAGKLKPGDRLPSENELSLRFGVSRITTKRALEMLDEEGLAQRVPGKGTFLLEREAGGSCGEAPCAQLIGLVITQFADEFGTALVRSIEAACRELGYQVVLNLTYESQKLEEEAIDRLLELGVCGLIVLPVHGEFYNSILLKLVLDKFPLVFVDRRLRGLEASTVSSDNVGAAKAATEYLVDRGHKLSLFVSWRMTNTSTLEDRLEGFLRAYIERGLGLDRDSQVLELPSISVLGIGGEGMMDIAGASALIRERLAAKPEISGILAAESTIGLIVRDILDELGDAAKDIEVICFDDPYHGRSYVDDRLIQIRQPELQMGREAVRIVHECIEGKKSGVEVINLPTELKAANVRQGNIS